MHALVAGDDDAAALLRRAVLPGGDDAAGAGDDRDHRHDVVGLDLGLDHQIDQPGRQHAIGVAVAAVARELDLVFHPAESGAVGLVHQERAGGEQDRFVERRAGAHVQIALARRAAIARRAAVAGKSLARERLVHHAEDRLAEAHQPDQRAPGRHAGDEGFGAVDRIEHPDIFGVGALGAVFLADDAVAREILPDEGAHGLLGGAVGGGHRVEAAGLLVVDRQRGAEKRQDGLARHAGELVDETAEIDGRHAVCLSHDRRNVAPVFPASSCGAR